MTNCINSSTLKYCLEQNYYVVGTNKSSSPGNAIIKQQSHYTIPFALNGIPIKVIGYDSFHSSEVETITIHAEITKIISHAFYNCVKLKFIQIPSTVVEIGWRAFCGARSLEKIFIEGRSQLQQIGNESFLTSSSSLTIVFCNSKIPTLIGERQFNPQTTIYLTSTFSIPNVTVIKISSNVCAFSYHNKPQTKYSDKIHLLRSIFFSLYLLNY